LGNPHRFHERIAACVLSVAVVLATVPPVGAVEKALGTIQVNGPAFAASGSAEWAQIMGPRPLFPGDRLKTGRDGYLVADLGAVGVIGLFGDTEVTTSESGDLFVVDVKTGKAAFHLEPGSRMRLTAKGASIVPGSSAADGYVEYDATGTPVVVMEGGALDVKLADGATKSVTRGERLALTATAQPEPAPVASAEEDARRATGAASAPPEKVKKKYAGLTPLGWTAVGLAAAGVAGGAAALAGGGGGGGGSNSEAGD
jgi:hypothetical protein